MIRCATATIRLDESHPAAPELDVRNPQLLAAPVATYRHHGWVLEKEQLIGPTRRHCARRLALQHAGIGIAPPAEATKAKSGRRVTDRRGAHRLHNDAPSQKGDPRTYSKTRPRGSIMS